MSSITNRRVLELRGDLRNPPTREAGLVRPVVRTLRLPRPLDPPRALLVRDHLRLPVLPQERLVVRRERGPRASLPLAAPDPRRAAVRAVVARANTAPVEVLRAVRGGGRPLAYDRPEVKRGEGTGVVAGRADVSLVAPGDLLRKRRDVDQLDQDRLKTKTHILREHLVDVRVHSHTLPVRCGLEALPGAARHRW